MPIRTRGYLRPPYGRKKGSWHFRDQLISPNRNLRVGFYLLERGQFRCDQTMLHISSGKPIGRVEHDWSLHLLQKSSILGLCWRHCNWVGRLTVILAQTPEKIPRAQTYTPELHVVCKTDMSSDGAPLVCNSRWITIKLACLRWVNLQRTHIWGDVSVLNLRELKRNHLE